PSLCFPHPTPPETYTLSLHDALPISYLNLMLTMLLGGLWHGANWTFVVWGGIHGAGLAVERLLTGESEIRDSSAFMARWLRRCRSEEHTSELQSQSNLVCRLLLEKKK